MRSRWLTRSEAARLLWASRRTQHLCRFILIGIYTGSRTNNILGLRWSQIDLAGGIMRRRPYGQAEDARKRAPPVRLGRRILAHLRRWKRLDGARADVVCHYDGRQIAKLRSSWDRAIRDAGLDGDVTPHVLRHTRATWGLKAGVPIWELAGHLGMTPATLTRTYGHHSADFQRNAADF